MRDACFSYSGVGIARHRHSLPFSATTADTSHLLPVFQRYLHPTPASAAGGSDPCPAAAPPPPTPPPPAPQKCRWRTWGGWSVLRGAALPV